MRSVFYNFGAGVISRILVTIIGVFIIAILTRHLGPEIYGQYSAVMAYLFIAGILADMGLSTILVRDISQFPEKEQDIVGYLFMLRLILVIIAVIIAGIVVWLLPYEVIIKQGVVIMALFVVFSSAVQLLLGVFQKYLKVYLVSIADIVMRVLQLGMILGLIYTDTLSITKIFVITVISEFIHFALVYFFASKLVAIRPRIQWKYWKKTLIDAFPIGVSLIFTLIYFRIDTVFLSLMRPAEEVGIYSIGYKVLELAIFFPALYASLIMSRLSEYAVSSKENFKKLCTKAFTIILMMGFPTAGYLYLFSDSIIALIGGNEFAQASQVVLILIPAVVMIFIGNIWGRALIAINLQKKAMWLYFFGALINIVGNAIFIPSFGFVAAAWTTVATEMIVTLGMFLLLNQQKLVQIDMQSLYKVIVSTLVMMSGIYFLKNYFFVSLIIAPIVYGLIIMILKVVTVKELKELVFNWKV